MRRTYISPEFLNKRVNGTLNMVEESNFFSAKMLEVEDSILIANENIIWHEMNSGSGNREHSRTQDFLFFGKQA